MLFEDPWQHDEFYTASHRLLAGSATAHRPGALPFQVDTELHANRLADAGFESVASEIVRSIHRLDTAAVVALYATLAVVLRRPHTDQQRVLEQLAELVDARFGGSVERTFVTAIYAGKNRSARSPR